MRRPSIFAGLLLCVLWGSGCTGGHPLVRPEAEWQSRAEALLDAGQVDSALAELKQAVGVYPQSEQLRRTYGRALRLRGGLMARLESARQLRTATGLDKTSARSHFELGLTYRDQGFDLYALDELKAALALDSSLHEAHLVIAELLLRDLERGPDEAKAAYIREHLHFLEGDTLLTLRALRCEALSYYWQGELDSVRQVLARGIWENVGDSVAVAAYRLRGLAEYEKNELVRADSVFELAQARADSVSRFDYDDVRYLVVPERYDSLSMLEPAAWRDSVAAIWRPLDPDISTAANERRVEYRARLAYADLHFGPRREDMPGRRTKRGEFYVRFGEPSWVERNMGDPEDFDMGVPTEIWGYEELPVPCTLAVVDEYLNGDYDFPYPDRQPKHFGGEYVNTDMPYIYADLVAVYPSEPEPLPGEELTPQVTWARRRGPDGLSRLELFYAIAHPDLKFERYHNRSRSIVTCDAVMYGDGGVEAARVSDSAQFIVTPTLTTNPNLAVIDQVTLDAAPGEYQFMLQLANVGTPNWGTVRGRLELPEYGDTLAMSDIVLARDVGEPLGGARMGRLSYLPAFAPKFSRQHELWVKYDIYNLALRMDARNDYEETTIVQPLKVKKGLWRSFASLLGAVGDTTSVATTRRVRDKETDPEREYQLDLSAYPPGLYRYTVVIHDLKAKREVRQSVEFELTE